MVLLADISQAVFISRSFSIFAGRGHSGAAAAADVDDFRSGQFVPVAAHCQHPFG